MAMSLGGVARIGFRVALSISSVEVTQEVYLRTDDVFSLHNRDWVINKAYFGVIRVLRNAMSQRVFLVSVFLFAGRLVFPSYAQLANARWVS